MQLTDEQRARLKQLGCQLYEIGRGTSQIHDLAIRHSLFTVIVYEDEIGFYPEECTDAGVDLWQAMLAAMPVAAVLGVAPVGVHLVSQAVLREELRDAHYRIQQNGEVGSGE